MNSNKIFAFLKELKKNNNKEWFTANKSRYEEIQEDLLGFVGAVLSKLEIIDKSLKGIQPKDCLFRIYKDVRFSKDKTPYKTGIGIYMKRGGKKFDGPGYYIHIEPGESFIGAGYYMPTPEHLFKIRDSIASNPDSIKKILSDKNYKKEFGSEFHGEKLKTVPRGFAKDHPDAELLKFKNYAVVKKLNDSDVFDKKFLDTCIQAFKAAYPFNNYIMDVIDRKKSS